jgi:hypothetical protein
MPCQINLSPPRLRCLFKAISFARRVAGRAESYHEPDDEASRESVGRCVCVHKIHYAWTAF